MCLFCVFDNMRYTKDGKLYLLWYYSNKKKRSNLFSPKTLLSKEPISFNYYDKDCIGICQEEFLFLIMVVTVQPAFRHCRSPSTGLSFFQAFQWLCRCRLDRSHVGGLMDHFFPLSHNHINQYTRYIASTESPLIQLMRFRLRQRIHVIALAMIKNLCKPRNGPPGGWIGRRTPRTNKY